MIKKLQKLITKVSLFEGKQIRRYWDEQKEEWYFSVVDIVEVLAQTDRPRKYWDDLKRKLKDEGSELSEKIGQLKMLAEDGKSRETDVADTERIWRRSLVGLLSREEILKNFQMERNNFKLIKMNKTFTKITKLIKSSAIFFVVGFLFFPLYNKQNIQ